MESNVCTDVQTIGKLQRSANKPGISAENLVQNWGIGLEAATMTVQATTQRAIRIVGCPTLSIWFRTNDRQLRYRCIKTYLFTDTMFFTVKSKRGNTCAQIFSHPSGWCRAFPCVKKSHTHEGFSLIFKRYGVPNEMVIDGSKEQSLGEFKRKCRECSCHIKQIEPYSHWCNSCEVSMKF